METFYMDTVLSNVGVKYNKSIQVISLQYICFITDIVVDAAEKHQGHAVTASKYNSI